MKRLRQKLTYANVTATLALVLAIGGGTVYAAVQLGRNDVRSRHLAPGAVKKSDVARNAVTSRKIRNRAIRGADIAPGLIRSLSADVTGTATGGPQGSIDTNNLNPVPLTGPTTFTPRGGEVAALAAEAEFEIASDTAGQFCSPAVGLLVNGQTTRVFASPDDGDSLTLITRNGYDADGPFGLLDPGTPHAITAVLQGDEHCTAQSRLVRLVIRIIQIH